MNQPPVLDARLMLELPARLTDVDSWHEHIPFAFFCVEQLRPRTLVELGTWKGDSYCAFCQAVQTLGLPTDCYAVDTWRGDAETGSYGPEVLDDLRAYHDPLYGGFSRLLEQTFDEARGYFADGSIDLLHIDGYHSYDAVRHDFTTWLPKMSERGVVLLHDTNVRERNFGVWQLWEEVAPQYPGFAFTHGHGLGVLAIGSNVDPGFLSFVDEAARPESHSSSFFFALGNRVALHGREQRLDRRAREVQEALAAKETEVAAARTELAAVHADRLRIEAELTGTLRSMSWRITAPLRRVHATLHRARRSSVTRRVRRGARSSPGDRPG
jgi:O-antigen biosynthesis protein